jgi:hypothetical protein
VDVRLAELAAVRVERQAAAHFNRTFRDEAGGFAARAEAEFFELDEHVGGEVVIQHRGPHVGGADAGLPPQLPGDDAHLRKRGQVVAVVAGHDVLPGPAALRRGGDHRGLPRQVARAVQPRDDDRHGAVAFLAAVEKAERLGDPA